jgi:20S proteasome subunit alpha 6
MSIGARAQSAKTYLERYYTEFEDSDLDSLVKHGLCALRDTLQQDKELNIDNTSVGIVGRDQKFEAVDGERLQRFLGLLGEETGRRERTSVLDEPAEAEAATEGEPVAMETDGV